MLICKIWLFFAIKFYKSGLANLFLDWIFKRVILVYQFHRLILTLLCIHIPIDWCYFTLSIFIQQLRKVFIVLTIS